MNFLFVCDSYFPKASPNGVCIQKVAEHLSQNKNNSVFVVTFKNEKYQPFHEIINNVQIFRVEQSFINRVIYSSKNKNGFLSKFLYKSILKISALNGFLKMFRYPLLSRKEVRNLYVMCKKLNKTYSIQYCITAYHKIQCVLAGIKLKKKNKAIKLVLYSLDSISGGYVPAICHSKKIPLNSLKRWEKYFLKNIDSLFLMEAHRKFSSNNCLYTKNSEKIKFLDIPLYSKRTKIFNNNNKKLNCLFTGSMSLNTANPSYLLKLINHFPKCDFNFYGSMAKEIENVFLSNNCLNKNLFFRGFCNHAEIEKMQDRADILLSFGNSNPNMIPCKIFEYFSTQNKIIHFYKSDNDSSLQYFKKYRNCLLVNENEPILENVNKIRKFMEMKEEMVYDCDDVFRKNMPQYFEDCIKLI